MARSAEQDPLEKFRFRVTILTLDPSLSGAVETLANTAQFSNPVLRVFTRAGFSKVTTPKVSVKEITYRENIDNTRFIKVPGLSNYEPITLSRGVTKNRDLYDWYRLVNDEIALLAVAGELSRDAQYTILQSEYFRKDVVIEVLYTILQSEYFRKDVVIEVLDREGKPIKAYYLFNCWPNAYSPGNDLDAQSEEKLVEELTLTYEFFLELEGGIESFTKEIEKNALAITGNIILQKLGNGFFGGGPR